MKSFVRRLHTVPRIAQDASVRVPGLFSPQAFKVAWTDHQADLVAQLNRTTVDTDNAVRAPLHVVLATAREPHHAHVFNYASQAVNNHLFFQGLKSSEAAETAAAGSTGPSAALQRRIAERFGGVEQLKAALFDAAESIHGNGWVFLVEQDNKKLAVIASNNAGSPFKVGREQSLDLNGVLSDDAAVALKAQKEAVAQDDKTFNIVLIALNLWQHAYVPDFGVAGRQAYMEAWWNALDWDKINSRLYA